MKIVYGRAHSGKSAAMFEALEKNAACGEKSIIIVPEQLSFRTEQRLAEHDFCGGLAQVLTFTKLAKRVGQTQVQKRRPISACGKTMLMYRALAKASSKLKLYHNAANKASMTPKLLQLAEEFSHIGADSAALAACVRDEKPLSLKLADLSLIFKNYEALLNEEFIDTDGSLRLCAALLEASGLCKDTHIYIDAFSDFSEPHFAVVCALEACAKSVSVFVCADEKLDTQGFFAPGAKTVQRLKATFAQAECVYLPPKKADGALAHFERVYTKYSVPVYAHEQTQIQVFEGRNPYAELHFVANEILRLCREQGYRFRDFAVVVGDGERYFESLSYIFARYGIPAFVSAKKSAAAHPLALGVLCALDIAEHGFRYDTVFAYLKSGFANISAQDADFLENYVLATGVGAKHWTAEEPWSFKASFFEEKNEVAAARADALRRKVAAPLLQLKAGIGKDHTVTESAQAIYAFLCALGLPEKTEAMLEALKEKKDFAAASIYRGTYNGVMQVLEQMSALCGEEKCGIARLRNMLSAGLMGQQQAIVPQRIDEVSVTDVAQGRFAECKVLFAIGTNAGAFCGFSGSEGILSDADRMQLRENGLSVLPTARHKAFDHRYTVYKTLTAPSEALYICYAVSDMTGHPLSVSPVAVRAKKLFAHLPQYTQDDFAGAVRSKHEGRQLLATDLSRVRDIKRVPPASAAVALALRERAPEVLELLSHCGDGVVQAKRLDKKNVEALYPKDISMSVTRLEKYSACPFSYFMTYMLGARERKVSSIGAPDIGNMVHLALEYFVDAAGAAGEPIAKMSAARILELTDAVTQRVTEEMFAGLASVTKSTQYFAKRLKINLERCVQTLVRHIALGKFEPVGTEVHFGDGDTLEAVCIGLNGGKQLKIHGVIDRLDKYEAADGTYYRVVDYKTGSKTFSMENILNGLDFQLMVYMAAALGEAADKKPAAVMYFRIREPMLSKDGVTEPDSIAAEVRKEMRLDGRCIDRQDILEAMDASGAQESEVFKLKYNKDGEMAKAVDVCTLQEFETLLECVRRSAAKVGEGLLNGEISILPVHTSKTDACRYCPQKPVCLNVGEGAFERGFDSDDAPDGDKEKQTKGGDGDAVDR